MITILIIVAVVLLLITATLYVNAEVEYDILNNIGKIKIKLYKTLTIFSSGITISDSYLNLNKKDNKVIKIKIDFDDEKFQFFKDIETYLIHKLYPTEINVAAVVAFENPFLSCIVGSIVGIFTNLMLARAKNSIKDVYVYNFIQTGFRQNMLKFNIKISIVFSLYDYFWAYLKAYKARKKREKIRRVEQSTGN